jgi:hypothetical protein
LQKLSSPALAAEKKKLRDQFEAHLIANREVARQKAERQVARDLREAQERAQRAEAEKEQGLKRLKKEYSERLDRQSESARREAESRVRKQLLDAEKRAKEADDQRRRGVEQARKDTEARLQKEVERAVRLATHENGIAVENLQAAREKDKLRHEADRAKLQGKLDDLSRKLDRQSGEQLGAEAELDLLTELRHNFCPNDKIERIGRGVRGADIVHEVREEGKIVGRIVYESKNTGDWHNSFLGQAKKYQTQYETPHVVVVTRALPSKQKGFCVAKGIPIIEKHMAVPLVTVIREGIIEIARLRLSGKSRDEKSKEVYEYIVGDKFGTRFREIAEGVSSLREQQKKERTWHENAWQAESKTHEQIEGRHREVEAQIRAIVRPGTNGTPYKPTTKSEGWPDDLANAPHGEPRLARGAASR